MKTKLLLALIVFGFAASAQASSPFMVKHATTEADGGRAVMPTNNGKSTTLAESLVQMRQCANNDPMGSSVTESQTPVHSSTPVKRLPE